MKGNMPLILQRPFRIIPGDVRFIFVSLTISGDWFETEVWFESGNLSHKQA